MSVCRACMHMCLKTGGRSHTRRPTIRVPAICVRRFVVQRLWSRQHWRRAVVALACHLICRCDLHAFQGASGRELETHEAVGFSTLPDQLVNRELSRGFTFNILCIGAWFSLYLSHPRWQLEIGRRNDFVASCGILTFQ